MSDLSFEDFLSTAGETFDPPKADNQDTEDTVEANEPEQVEENIDTSTNAEDNGEQASDDNQNEEDDIEYQIDLGNGLTAVKHKEIVEALNNRPKAEDQEELSYYRQISPVIDTVKQSPTIKEFLKWKFNERGYTEEQIIDGLFLMRHPDFNNYIEKMRAEQAKLQEEPAMPEFESLEDEINYRVQKGIEAALKEKVAPIEEQVNYFKQQQLTQQQQREAYEQQQQLEAIYNNNDALLNAAAQKVYGLTPNDYTESDVKAFGETFSKFYPGVDMMKMPLNEMQATILVKEALAGRQVKSASLTRGKNPERLPNILGSQGPNSNTPKPYPRQQVYEYQSAEALEAVDKLFN